MWRNSLRLASCLGAAVGTAACTPAVGEDAALSVDRGACERQRVLVSAPEAEHTWSTACWERTEEPEEVAAGAALDTGEVAEPEADALARYAIFSPAGEPCLDRVAVPPSARERPDGVKALHTASSFAGWDDLPAEHRCGGDA